jgi:hypothetical protein
MSVEGTWDLTIATPIGRIKAVVDLRREQGALVGSAQGAGEQVPLRDLVLDGDRLTWRQAITKPLRLNLDFSVTVDGDTLAGTSKAGRLPSSKVVGQRRNAFSAAHAGAEALRRTAPRR